jgi:sugar diacid utilization regulator
MKTTNLALTVVFALTLTLGASLALAQQAKTEKPSDQKEMGGCPHMMATKASLDKLQKTLDAGRQSNDPAQMKASFEKAQTELAEARKQMSMCPMMSGGMMHHGDMQDMDEMDHMTNSPENGQKK